MEDKKLAVIGAIIMFASVGISMAICKDSYFLMILLSIFIFCVIAGICAGITVAVSNKKTNDIIKKVEQETAAKKKEADRKIKDESFEFPAEEFYRSCSESSISDLDNQYSITKAARIAKDLMDKTAGIKLQDYGNYLHKDKLAQFLATGECLAKEADERQIRQQKQPRAAANATAAEMTFLTRASELAKLSGNEKRVTMLDNLLHDYHKKIADLRAGEEALKTLGMIYADQQKKEGDWAIMGGIAEGIAGVGAGVAVAANTMANNAKIREYNASMRKASLEVMSGLPTVAGDRYTLEKESDKILQRISEAANKIVLSQPTGDEIWKELSVGKVDVKQKESGVLALAVPIALKHPLELDVPDGVVMVVDGILEAEVWFEDSLVDTVHIPFPIYGIPCNSTEKTVLDGMCGSSVAYKDSKYKVKFKDKQNLWVMEA